MRDRYPFILAFISSEKKEKNIDYMAQYENENVVEIKDEIESICSVCHRFLSQNCSHCWYAFCFACFRSSCPNCDMVQPGQENDEEQAEESIPEDTDVVNNPSSELITGDPSPPAEKKPKLSKKPGSEDCLRHEGKSLELYCLTCERRVCTECLVNGRDHKRHTIDSLSEIYREKLEVTKSKLKEVENYINAIRKTNDDKKLIQYRVLEIEQDMLKRLEQLFQQAKQEIINSAKSQKQLLVRNSRMPGRSGKVLEQLAERMHSMSQGNFIEEQSKVHQQLDDLMCKPISYYQAAKRDYYDIKCNLLPRIRLLPTTVKMFDTESSAQDALLIPKIPVSDNNGNKWELIFNKDEILSVQVATKECSMSGSFLAVIVLLNDDPLKVYQVQIPITSPAPMDTVPSVELFETSKLQSDGYVCAQGQLKLHCGIGPADPITERVYYKAFIDRQHNEINSLKKTIRQLSQFTVGTFIINNVHPPDQKKQTEQCYLSQKIYDWNMTEWRLNINDGPSDGFIGVFINKCNGPNGKYEYFIELLHASSPAQNCKVSTVYQFEQGLHGHARFLPRTKLSGFLRNGCLRFRYGVRSIPENDI